MTQITCPVLSLQVYNMNGVCAKWVCPSSTRQVFSNYKLPGGLQGSGRVKVVFIRDSFAVKQVPR